MKKDTWGFALRIMARLSGWIAFPVIIGVFLGKWLDRQLNTEPWMFLGTIGFSFLISMYGLAINATKEFKRIEDEYKLPAGKEIKGVVGNGAVAGSDIREVNQSITMNKKN